MREWGEWNLFELVKNERNKGNLVNERHKG